MAIQARLRFRDPPRPSSVRAHHICQYRTQFCFRSRDPPWLISLRMVRSTALTCKYLHMTLRRRKNRILTNLHRHNRRETTPRHSCMYAAEFRSLFDTCRWRYPPRRNFRKMTPIGWQAARCLRQAVCPALRMYHLTRTCVYNLHITKYTMKQLAAAHSGWLDL